MDETINRSTLRHAVRDAVIKRIVSGRLAPGERVNESILAKQLGVSATPVREALLSLEGCRYLAATPGRGFTVAPFDAKEVHEIYTVLAELDAMALRLCPTFTSRMVVRLRKLNNSFRAQGTVEKAIRADVRWHRELVSSCPNTYLHDLIRSGRDAVQRYEYAFLDSVMNTHVSAEQHERVIAALEVGNRQEAIQELTANWYRMIELLIPCLEDHPGLRERDADR